MRRNRVCGRLSQSRLKGRRSGLSRRDSERGRITLLMRLYDLATMSNHGYNIYVISGRIFVFRSRSTRGAIPCFFSPSGCPFARFEIRKERSLSSSSFAPRRPDRRRLCRHLGSCCRDGASCRGNDVTRGVEWRIPSARRTECKAYIWRQRR